MTAQPSGAGGLQFDVTARLGGLASAATNSLFGSRATLLAERADNIRGYYRRLERRVDATAQAEEIPQHDVVKLSCWRLTRI
jgi:hypothetical protein